MYQGPPKKGIEANKNEGPTSESGTKNPPEDKAALLQSFINILREETEKLNSPSASWRIVISPEEMEKYKAFFIFKKGLERLIAEPAFPSAQKTSLRLLLMSLDTHSPLTPGAMADFDMWYPGAVGGIFSLLDKILTPEASAAFRSYAERIFVDPLK